MQPKQIKKINAVLHTWDPIGMTPEDEYYDLAIKIFQCIESGHTGVELVSFIAHYLQDVVGLSNVNSKEIESAVIEIMLQCGSNKTNE